MTKHDLIAAIENGLVAARKAGQASEMVAIVHPDDQVVGSVPGTHFVEARAGDAGETIRIFGRSDHPRHRVTVLPKVDFEADA